MWLIICHQCSPIQDLGVVNFWRSMALAATGIYAPTLLRGRNRVYVLAAATIVFGASTLGTALTTSYHVYFALRCVNGIGMCAGVLVANWQVCWILSVHFALRCINWIGYVCRLVGVCWQVC